MKCAISSRPSPRPNIARRPPSTISRRSDASPISSIHPRVGQIGRARTSPDVGVRVGPGRGPRLVKMEFDDDPASAEGDDAKASPRFGRPSPFQTSGARADELFLILLL